MNKALSMTSLCLLCLSTYVCSANASNISIPQKVIDKIKLDYSMKSEFTAGLSSISIQYEQILKFKTLNKVFEVVPFTYIPNKDGVWQKCVIRILAMPNFLFLQDLEIYNENKDELPCNGVLAFSFKDVNSDNVKDIIVLLDYSTPGNKSIEPDAFIYVYEPASQRFFLNKQLSLKATNKSVRNMKDVLKNLNVFP